MRYFSALLKAALVLTLFLPNTTHAGGNETYPAINPANVTIVRDSFGIPHIFAKTDAEVAFGLAWANAEDAFHETQNLIYIAKGYTARAQGVEGAKADFFAHAVGARRFVEEHYDADVSEEFKRYLNGFSQGMNAYVKAHPGAAVIEKAFPIDNKDLLTAYVVTLSFMSGADGPIGDIVAGKYDDKPVQFPLNMQENSMGPVGSNAFAFSSKKTVDGKTYLCVNPHLYMNGALSFYEAHLQSEEGLNVQGALFQGTASVIMGTNNNLGWAMTWNHFDKLDVFKLKMHPRKKQYYELDGVYHKLEKRPVWLKVGLGKNHKTVIPVKKTTYWSKYGATLKSGKARQFYAVRFPANMSVKIAEQLFRMDKSRNYNEFWQALRMQGIPLFNMVYADKEDNLLYISYGMVPERNEGFAWDGILPGNTSKTLWTGLVPVEQLPQVANPDCGYVFNTNNSPFIATSPGCNDDSCRLPKYFSQRNGDNNRSWRFKEMVSELDKVSFADVKRIKFDVKLSEKGAFADSYRPLFNLDAAKYPDLKEAIEILRTWNRVADTAELAPTLFASVIDVTFKTHGCSDDCFISGAPVTEQELVTALRNTCDSLKKYFGTVRVPWGKVNRVSRGNKEVTWASFPDVMSPCYPQREAGPGLKYNQRYGDTYTMFVKYGPNGVEQAEALQPLGNSINPESEHYNDQMELFRTRTMRVVQLDKEAVMKRAKVVYHPQ